MEKQLNQTGIIDEEGYEMANRVYRGGVLPYVKNKPISHEGNKEVRAADYKDPSQMV